MQLVSTYTSIIELCFPAISESLFASKQINLFFDFKELCDSNVWLMKAVAVKYYRLKFRSHRCSQACFYFPVFFSSTNFFRPITVISFPGISFSVILILSSLSVFLLEYLRLKYYAWLNDLKVLIFDWSIKLMSFIFYFFFLNLWFLSVQLVFIFLPCMNISTASSQGFSFCPWLWQSLL